MLTLTAECYPKKETRLKTRRVLSFPRPTLEQVSQRQREVVSVVALEIERPLIACRRIEGVNRLRQRIWPAGSGLACRSGQDRLLGVAADRRAVGLTPLARVTIDVLEQLAGNVEEVGDVQLDAEVLS